ncbi:MAG: ribosome biogenesis GTPase YlqF [Oscillospiraceae bacterium]|nr:ribosome biogenesis GTPase YlqF [Oscillospiraceae bacterium]
MEAVDIQWFPGHMAKTRRLMKANLPLVDVVVEITDARVPASSRNPEMKNLVGGKPRVVVLNKCDMADEALTAEWIEYYRANGVKAIAMDCRSGKGLNKLVPTVKEVMKKELEKRAAKGMEGKPIRIMVVGIPNVGKSSFINRVAGGKRTKVEDRPGVTRGKQWVTLEKGIDLLDMPGVLWPKFDDKTVGEHLAFTGAIKDDILDTELLAMRLADLLNREWHSLLCERYKLTDEETADIEPYDLLSLIGAKRGMKVSGGDVNTERAAAMLLDEFRGGKIGRITLEMPNELV